MRILVVDDTQRHLDAAMQQLSGPDTEVVTLRTYSEAFKRLASTRWDTEKKGYVPNEEKFDVVLTDLLMPAERGIAQDARYAGLDFPVGLMLMVRAVQAGVTLIAVVSARNHHMHPAADAMDFISSDGWHDGKPLPPTSPIKMNASWVLVTNAPQSQDGWSKDWSMVLAALKAATAGE